MGFLGAQFLVQGFFGVLLEAQGSFWILIFAPIRSSPYLKLGDLPWDR